MATRKKTVKKTAPKNTGAARSKSPKINPESPVQEPVTDPADIVTDTPTAEGLTTDASEHPIADEIINPVANEVEIQPGQPVVEELETIIEEQVIEEEEPPVETDQFKSRNPLTGMFNKEEREYIEIHLQSRIGAGITRDANHFIRQCVNFCINYTPGWQFGRAKVPRKHLEE